MTTAEATPDFEVGDRNDRAFIGHPKGLGYLSFVEGCERFSYYSMQTLLVLYMVKYLLTPERMAGVVGLDWLRSWHYTGLEGQQLSSAIYGDYSSLVYLTPILGGVIADRFAGRRAALLAGGLVMSLGHFLMAIEGAFVFALLALIVGVGLFKGNIASQVGALYKDNDLRRAMAFQIFYIAINVSVIVGPLISGTLGEKVGWHYGFGCAGIVMVLGVLLFLAGRPHLPEDDAGREMNSTRTLGAIALGTILSLLVIGIVFALGITITVLALIPLYFFLTYRLQRADKARVLGLCLLIPALAISLLTNQEIFNAYLVWADEHFQLTFAGNTLPTSWMITLDATLSFAMLVAVAAFYKWYGTRRNEPDELNKMIIGSFFTIAGGLCLYLAALTQGSGKIGLFWPFMFHLLNSIGFAHILPVSLALFSKIAPRQINATVIGLYYLAFFAANKIVGEVGKLYSTMDTPTFWLLHVGSAVVGLVAFIVFKLAIGKRMDSTVEDQAAALS
ncbi:peptide MFS transporter [Sphingomonas sinipercae]|uniref:Peptide MFS transporter n=1 Tax=Sphingomonas sinipercae TaxID=2714944 RepID=A0A6G7ZLC6_9SPHN|nr:peptide MFS transporter [Sphingomonas sinipercae]QIL01784.1 peptide MFS transporter [Sphingomonas sinipercae]